MSDIDINKALPASELKILSLEQPGSTPNDGSIAFGPEGHLYIVLGDGKEAGDTDNKSQNRSTQPGSVLRIDTDSGDPYNIPSDNPY